MIRQPEDLRREWLALRAHKERLHALDIAERLGASECALLASACGAAGEITATRLDADWSRFLAEMPALGHVKTVTRNPHAVIEVEGSYSNVEFFGPMGQSVGTVDLRIFVNRWRYAFAVREETRRGLSQGVQFFDAGGRAIHKVYLRDGSDHAYFEALVRAHTSANQSPAQSVETIAPDPPPPPDTQVDVAGLREAWRAMTDTHQFFGLLRRFGVARTHALRLAGDDLATPLAPTALERALYEARDAETPFMTFVGNPGVIQIHTGIAKKVAAVGPWINVLDPGFDLHVRTDRIDQAWLVRKPTADGIVTSLELYDAAGEQIALLVGKRKPGQAESEAWRAVVARLPSASNGASNSKEVSS